MVTATPINKKNRGIFKLKKSILFITRAAVIAAIYFALSTAVNAIAFGPIQFRISEMLVLLPILMPEAIPGLAIGCFFTNFFFSPFGIYDMLFGTLATLLGAICTYLLRKNVPLSALPPILFNALLIPLIWVCDGSSTIYYIAMFEIFASEFIICGIIGVPFTLLLRKALLAARVIDLTHGKYGNVPAYRHIEGRVELDDDESDADTPFILLSDIDKDTITNKESEYSPANTDSAKTDSDSVKNIASDKEDTAKASAQKPPSGARDNNIL